MAGRTRAVWITLAIAILGAAVLSTIGLLPHLWSNRLIGIGLAMVQLLAIGRRHALRREVDAMAV
jgi:hypothetical protein